MCPNTRIEIATFRNPSHDDFNITGGDYPISLLRANTTIQCGIDGERSNNCVLSGGLVHVIATNQHYHPVYGYLDPTENIDNVVVKGFTFTGLMRGSDVFGGVPIAISHPGQNIRLEDCVWRDMTASKRVFWVGTNYLMSLLGLQVLVMSTEVSIEKCLFEDIYYEEES
jgi:hypothetical protein